MTGERVALIVAVDEYRHPGLAGLTSPGADADALAGALGDPERGDFQVEVLHNEDSSVIAERVEALMDRRADDVVLLHFSCHGMKDPSGELFLAATNTRPDRLASTAVDAAMVNRLMRRSRARRVVLLLDCCYGGAFERGVIARAAGTVDVGEQFAQDALGGGRGRVVITASSAVEYAFEGSALTQREGLRPSYFTGAVVEGIVTGKADRDNDGRVSVGELYDYVYDRVREQTPEQTPSKWEFGTTGELFISRNPTPVIVPDKIPDPLLDLIGHPIADVRLTAVHQLAAMASGPRLGVALAAVQALRGMLGDDSRQVETEVAEALRTVAPHVSDKAVDFGVLAVGAATPTATITVTAPPLALSFTTSTFPSALIAKKEGRTVHLAVDTTTPAHITGRVTIDSPAGTAVVAVTAIVDSNPEIGATNPAALLWLAISLILLGSSLTGIAVFLPQTAGSYPFVPLKGVALVGFVGIELPSLVAALGTVSWKWLPQGCVSFGVILGATLFNLTVVIDIALTVLREPDSSLAIGWWACLMGVSIALGGISVSLKGSSGPNLAISVKRDSWTAGGIALISMGLLGIVIDDIATSSTLTGRWDDPVLMALSAVPVALFRLGRTRRVTAISMMITFVAIWILRLALQLIEYGAVSFAYQWFMILAMIAVVAGCILSQFGHKHTSPSLQDPQQ